MVGDRTIAKSIGERWPRLLTVNMAAGYCGIAGVNAFMKIPELAALVRKTFGDRERVDRVELDALIDSGLTEGVAR